MLNFVIVLVALLAAANADDSDEGRKSNYTVTHEAWFEFQVKDLDGEGEHYTGKMTFALFGEAVPMTVLNFVSLAKGYSIRDKKLSYKDTPVHRIVPDLLVQMGDVTNQDGTGGESIYGKKFNDENFFLSHRTGGYMSMANYGTDTNGSQFFIVLNKARWLDDSHVVFGKIIKGYDTLRTLAEVPAERNTGVPEKKITIIGCGAKQLETSYELSPEQQDANEDI